MSGFRLQEPNHSVFLSSLLALDDVEPDVLDTEAIEDGASDLEGYRSVRAGEPPKKHTFKNNDEEADFIAADLAASPVRPVLILARTRKALSALTQRLRARGVTCTQLEDADVMPQGDHVILATLHRSKGLEAPRVILAAMQEVPLRFPGGTDDDKLQWQRKERLLVYVGMTRARDACTLTRVEIAS